MRDVASILKQRAKELAHKNDSQLSKENLFELIEFKLSSERYALESCYLGEVQSVKSITKVPYLPKHIEGIVYLRGRFVSVVNLARYLQVDTDETHTKKSALMMLSYGLNEFCILVDEVLGSSLRAKSEFEEIGLTHSFSKPELLVGVSKDALSLIDAQKLLEEPEMKIYQEV